MLEKAHRIDPSNREVLEKCIEAVERLGDPRRLAGHLATLGNLSIGCGDSEEAIELLEQAHHQDPENFSVLFALRDAFAQLGDSERCADISLKLVRAYSEDGNLAQAIEACQTGLELSPESVPLRFYLGQTLFQANRGEEAREEILTLIQETRSSAKAMKSEKAHDLLTRCYRLLLKLNPRDREAHDGLHELARRRLNAIRRRKLAVWGSIAGSILLVVVRAPSRERRGRPGACHPVGDQQAPVGRAHRQAKAREDDQDGLRRRAVGDPNGAPGAIAT
jgi:tetratricopeptide (TPR) repeat protein